MKKIILLCLFCLCCACARPVTQAPQSDAAPEAIWHKMEAVGAESDGPYRIQLSMRFGDEGDTRRVTGLLWGNDDNAFRLDVMAGVGATIAMISEAGPDFKVYMPRENRAYFHEGSNRPLLKIGVPVPFNLAQLTAILNGRFDQVFTQEPETGTMLANGGASFKLAGPFAGTLEIDAQGLPYKWQQASGGWTLDLAYDAETVLLPKSLKLVNLNGRRAIILVKEREKPAQPYNESQLQMTIPDGTPLLPLSQFKSS